MFRAAGIPAAFFYCPREAQINAALWLWTLNDTLGPEAAATTHSTNKTWTLLNEIGTINGHIKISKPTCSFPCTQIKKY